MQIETLQRLKNRKHESHVQEIASSIKQTLATAQTYTDNPIETCRNQLLGIEGTLNKKYFKVLQNFLPAPFQFDKRSRRPAVDFFNAALNYLYGMTYSIVESGVFAKGLDPFIGYMHTDNYQKTSLVFDLIEPIRPLIDRILIELCTTNQLAENHFIAKEQGYWLAKEGKRILIPTFNEYLYKRIKVRGQVRRLKDIIYYESNDLGNLINNSIEI